VPLDYSAELGPLDRLKNNVALTARRRIFDLFMRELHPRPDERVADFGVSGHQDHPVHYFFESWYPHRQNLTAIGRAVEDANWLPRSFPGLSFLEADLRSIPLPDNYFDAGLCNAVVEHAGMSSDQGALVTEVCRVCKRVLFTTPNKQFPIELHTFLPLVHWLPDPAFRRTLRRLGFNNFADVETLNPLDADAFLSLFPAGRSTRLLSKKPLLLRSNLVAVSVVSSEVLLGASTSSSLIAG
jgi:hypothetical protein